MVGITTSWKKTLHLPKSPFPARPLLKDRPKYIKRCTDDLYAWQRNRKISKTFTLHDGPPYANGELHIGHALNKIVKDITCRSRLPDHRVDWRPGWDCHGLPIELKALQQQGERASRDETGIRAIARRLATKTVQSQKQAFRKWAIMADWDNAWTTMDGDFEIKQLKVFQRMVKRGLIYRRFKPVYWSPSSRTALAEAELEYRDDHVSTAAFIKYPLHKASDALKDKLDCDVRDVNAVIWTTTPWTLPANRAIGIHQDIEYTLVRSTTHGTLLVATSMLPEMARHLDEALETVASIGGKALVGTTYADPVFDVNSPPRPFLHANFVSETSGSGLVHLAPGHGKDDYELCLQKKIMAFAPIDDEGRFTAAAYPGDREYLEGKEVLGQGNQAVLNLLHKQGQLLNQHQYSHKYPYDWRSKQPVVLRATEQWFANVGDIRDDAIQALETVNFIPPSSRTRLQAFVKNRSEWCISRQRAWGVPIPALYNTKTNEALLTDAIVSHIIAMIKARGIDAWWTDDDADPSWTPAALRDVDGKSPYRRCRDTMDVWFDSGTSWTQTSKNDVDDTQVADCYIEGTDQHRGWFQSSLLTHVAFQGGHAGNEVLAKAPFETLVTHGFTLDQDGRKMSKSVGNVVAPDEIINGTLLPITKRKVNGQWVEFVDAMGPDALRLWIASCDYTTDVKVSETALQAIHANLSKYRVTFKMMLGILADFDPARYESPKDLGMTHLITFWRLKSTISKVQRSYRSFDFSMVVNEINKFVTNDLSSSYFEWIKDAAYCGTIEERLQVQGTLYHIFCQLQQMLTPIIPLLIEEVWDYTPQQIKDHERIPPGQRPRVELAFQSINQGQLEDDIPHLMQALAAVRSIQETARSLKNMGDSLQSNVCVESGSVEVQDLFSRYSKQQLQTLFGVSGLACISDKANLTELLTAKWAYKGHLSLFGNDVQMHVYEPQLAKCIRCWRYVAPVGKEEGRALCARCEEVMDGIRKTRPGIFD